ncbi:hypothetical protein ABZY90_28345 [Streptomyces sp. NPDC006422]|uniref:hypothetical protein n=1 Tax=unclassified Streptomyces TaxID=2593676 RepID=UPI0033B6A1BF
MTTAPRTADEALAIARTTFQPLCADGTPATLNVQEFDLGFLIYATFPPTEPPSYGGSHLVISKTDGSTMYVPNFPPDSAISLYRRTVGQG